MSSRSRFGRGVGRLGRMVVVVVAPVLVAVALVAGPAAADDSGANLAGRLVQADGSAWDATPWTVTAVPVDGAGDQVDTAVASDGSYRLAGVRDGRYRIRAVPAEERSGIPAMWLGGTLREDEATVVDVRAGRDLDGLDVVRFDGSNLPRRATATWRPYVKGTPKVGWTLTADPQEWTVEDDWFGGPMPVTDDLFTFQWLADGRPVAGATDRTFAPTASQLGRSLSVRVGVDLPNTTTSNDTSASTAVVVQGRNAPCSRVTLTGKAKVGRTLVASRSRCWAAPGTKVTHVWYADGRRVATTTSPRLTLRKKLRGDRVSVRVVATAPGYAKATVRTTTRKVR